MNTRSGPAPRSIRLTASLALLAVVMIALGLESFSATIASLRDASIGEFPGPLVIIGSALIATGVALGLAALKAYTPVRSLRASFFTFGCGWIVGVLLDMMLTAARRTAPTYSDSSSLLIDVLTWGLVLLLLGAPGLASLMLARRIPG